MELQEIKTFIAVAQAESFSIAAGQLGYSQAAVTIRIKNLEEELGVRLFDRLGKTISLTDRGEYFYNEMIPLMNQMEDICSGLQPESVPGGHIHIGTIDSMANTIMLEVVQKMRKDYPGVKISVTTDTPERLYEMLKKNQIDILYLIDEKVKEKWAKTLYCEKEKILMVADKTHKLADKKKHTLSE
nr:LysR family transcriptional regulator [Lachnospiraceae bacterium]